jgi:alkylated DNA repair dioxygenase AlkB
MAVHQASLFPVSSSPPFLASFRYCAEAIKPEDECSLVDQIAELPFKEFEFHGFEGKRRVVSFGCRYDFSQHKALPADPVPPFLLDFYRKVQAASGFVLPRLQQVLVTEYSPGAPIGWHKDRPVFNDVMGLSLASSCTFRLRRLVAKGQWERAAVHLERRSAYFLHGPARWQWEHSIPPLQKLRYSITFRNLRHSQDGAVSAESPAPAPESDR